MADFLFEIYSEEIPARMQTAARQQMADMATKFLHQADVPHATLQTFVTPQRLVLHIQGLPLQTEAQSVEVRGPRIDAPDQALQGFLRTQNLTQDQLVQLETPKGTFWSATVTRPGQAVGDLLTRLIQHLLADFTWPKTMIWPQVSLPWIRPIRSLLALWNNAPLRSEFFGLTTGTVTFGHRQLAPDAITCATIPDYFASLARNHVLLDQDQRRAEILNQLQDLAQTHHKTHGDFTLDIDENLLTEVTGLVEFPHVISAPIADKYRTLPYPVIKTALQNHQRYFMGTGGGRVFFVVVANRTTVDQSQEMLRGYDRVLRARLEDAAFFQTQDLSQPLGDYNARLHQVTFYKGLGTVYDKVQRLQKLTLAIAQAVGVDADAACQAAALCKSDLATQMVGEFPELQGIMGGIYATAQGLPDAVSQAVAQHYKPAGKDDDLPTGIAAQILALADRIDTLVGFFGIGVMPTSSKDPFALRRAALGVLRLMQSQDFEALDLSRLCTDAAALYPSGTLTHKSWSTDLDKFCRERLTVYLRETGYRHDIVAAVMAPQQQLTQLYPIAQNIQALTHILGQPQGQAMLQAYWRSYKILNGTSGFVSVRQDLLSDLAEQNLYKFLGDLPPLQSAHHLKDLLSAEASMYAEAVERFFDDVLINADQADVRANRLSLAKMACTWLDSIADFSKIEE